MSDKPIRVDADSVFSPLNRLVAEARLTRAEREEVEHSLKVFAVLLKEAAQRPAAPPEKPLAPPEITVD